MPPSRPPVLKLETLLSPIPGGNPSGENLQYSGLYDEIREARRADDDAPQGDWVHKLKVADWERVVRVSTDALSSKTKDLQITAWLCEAAVSVHGFVGLRDSLRLASGLLTTFWETLYPEIDEGNDLEARANALAWLERQAAVAVQKVPLTRRPGNAANYSFFQWEGAKQLDFPADTSNLSSKALELLEEKRRQAQADGKPMADDIRKGRSETRRAFYEDLVVDVEDVWSALKELDRTMDQRFGTGKTPGLGSLTKSLEAIRAALESTVREKRLQEPDPSTAADGEGAEGISAPSRGGGGAGPIQAREQALAQLVQVADYFRRTEPHSPVSYLVQRAVGWGRMPLDTWLQDVIKDATTLANLRETLGMKDEAGGDGTGN